ncbi:MAG TPA: diacylglycerol kinase family protein [Longimicrobium sp.]|nr:diacylglycerol kinase family protein [Longimicrobium sp.]
MNTPIPAFVNPASGSAAAALDILRGDARFSVREVAPDALPGAVREAVAAGARRVLVSGGDGTLGNAAGALLGTECEMAVLPGGTLNHFARDVGLPRNDLAACVELAVSGDARPVDVGLVNGHVFLNTSSFGAYVTFVRARERLEERMGYRAASVLATLRIWFNLSGFDVAVSDGETTRRFHTPLLFVGVGEREFERREMGARIAGGQRALHMFVLRETAPARVLGRALVVLARGMRWLAETESLEAELVPSFTARLRRPWGRVAVDGELLRLRAPLEYSFAPDALRVVLPPIVEAGEAERPPVQRGGSAGPS